MSPSPSPRRSAPAWLVPIGIVAAAAVAIWLILQAQGGSDPAPTPQQAAASPSPTEESAKPDAAADPPTQVDREQAPDLSRVERRDAADPLAQGDVDAPVVLVVFSDYQCPYCAKWSAETLPALESYVDAGELRIEFRDVNVFGEASVRGARAAYAAALQGEFQAMHHALFEDGMPRASTQLTDEHLIARAVELGLDRAQFEADYAAEDTAEAVAENERLGLDIGAFSTPSFVVAGQPLVGAQPTEVFVDVVESALAQSGAGD